MTRTRKPDKGMITRKPINNSVDKKLYETLDELHKETDVPKSKLLDQGLRLLFKKYGKQVEEDENE